MFSLLAFTLINFIFFTFFLLFFYFSGYITVVAYRREIRECA